MTPDLRHIRTFKQLVRYLEDELGWPLEGYDVEELTYDYEPDEIGLKPAEAAKVKTIRQLRPLAADQPWGIFFIEFDRKKLPVAVLRRILSHLVVKKRATAGRAERAAWQADDLIFISAFGAADDDSREIGVAHFHQDPGDLPTLRVLGWDAGDTALKIEHVDRLLHDRLRWRQPGESLENWRQRWVGAFRNRLGHAIKTADRLAEVLAAFARRIRLATLDLLEAETDRGPLTKLYRGFQTALIHDLTPEGFADTYAQTITYGLFTAAVNRTDMSGGTEGTYVKADDITLMARSTSPFLREMLEAFLHVGGRKNGVDFDELGIQDIVELLRGDETDLPEILRNFGDKKPGEDPVIHFYEHFLSAYNKQLKVQRGVFYTPQPIVSYIVRSVHELLQTEFGLEDGLAATITWGEMIKQHPELNLPPLTDEAGCKDTISPDEFFVQILDPATGTATFLVEVIDNIFRHLEAKWAKGGATAMPRLPSLNSQPSTFNSYWNAYVAKALLPRLHGYELLAAPYAIAHLKVGLKLTETGYHFDSDERARIYLTNALEPWVKQMPLIGFEPLAHEAAAVNEVKRHKRFTVVIGNPPYAGISSNMTEKAQRIVDAYKFVDGGALNERKLWLQDDYVKFIRKAQTIIDSSEVGVFGYITNHGYLDNPTFRGMRRSLMETFQWLCVLDLHGNANKKEEAPDGSEDKNVFDIRQGVAICLATRGGAASGINHSDLWGSRESKYAWLANDCVENSDFAPLTPDSPYYFFEPQNTDCRPEYDKGWKINEAMPVNSAGFITARDRFVMDFDEDALLSRIADFANQRVSDAEIRTRYFAGCGSDKYPEGDTRGWKVPAARQRVQQDKKRRERLTRCLYRPFDFRTVYWADWMVDWPRPEVMAQMLHGDNLALLTARSNKTSGTDHFFCSSYISETKCAEYSTQSAVFPLYTFQRVMAAQGGLALGSDKQPNFAPAFLHEFSSALKLEQTKPHSLPAGLTAEEIFHYAYTVFHSPGYRSRYAEFLKIDFPRLPLTGNLDLFCALAQLGGELVALHLLKSPKLNKPITEFIGKARDVAKVGYTDETVWIDAGGTKSKTTAGTSGFKDVPEKVWNFHIGGYQVCEKWLKDRKGRTLTKDDIAHYHKIVVALSETIRLMAEIDKVIDQHGGWPGAFSTPQTETAA